MKGLLKKVVVALLVFVVAVGSWFYFIFMKSPMFSLGLAGYAYYKKDFSAFEQVVDINAIVVNGYDVLSPIYLGSARKTVQTVVKHWTNTLAKKGLFGKMAAKKAADAAGKIDPAIKKKLVAEVRKTAQQFFVEDNTASQNNTADSGSGSKLSFKSIKEVERVDGNALIEVVLQNGMKEDLPIDLRMESIQGDRWKIVAIENIPYIAANAKKFNQ